MTTSGDTSAKVILSTAVSGSAGSETPSGDLYYLIVEKWKDNRKHVMKRTPLAGGTVTGVSTGKRDWDIQLSNVYPVTFTGYATQDLAYNHMKLFFNTKCKSGAAAFYIFILSVQGNYVELGYNGTINLRPMKVKISDYPSEPDGGLLMFSSLGLVEVTSG
jgi:hypothetical protein